MITKQYIITGSLRPLILVLSLLGCASATPRKCSLGDYSTHNLLASVTDCCEPTKVTWNPGDCCQAINGPCVCKMGTKCFHKPKTVPANPKVTTKTPTKAPAPGAKKVCSSFRLLNGEKADNCKFPGAARVISVKNGVNFTICNAAFVKPMIKGKVEPAFFVSQACHKFIQNTNKASPSVFFVINGEVSIPTYVPALINTVTEKSGTSVFYLIKEAFASIVNYPNDPCRRPACTYEEATMDGQIDFQDCYVVSFGASTKAKDYKGLQKKKVTYQPSSVCSGVKLLLGEENSMCFKAADGKHLYCQGDGGAPVYCNSRSKEPVLLGLTATQKDCDKTPYARVVPYPKSRTLVIPTTAKPKTA